MTVRHICRLRLPARHLDAADNVPVYWLACSIPHTSTAHLHIPPRPDQGRALLALQTTGVCTHREPDLSLYCSTQPAVEPVRPRSTAVTQRFGNSGWR